MCGREGVIVLFIPLAIVQTSVITSLDMKKQIDLLNFAMTYLRSAVYPPTIMVSAPTDIEPWYRRPFQGSSKFIKLC